MTPNSTQHVYVPTQPQGVHALWCKRIDAGFIRSWYGTPIVRPFDDAWADAIDDAVWPEYLTQAIRIDPSALATARAVETLRNWRKDVLSPSTPEEAQTASNALEAVANALLNPEPEPPKGRVSTPATIPPHQAPSEDQSGSKPPPAAAAKVRAMAMTLGPLTEEIVPLARPRRPRRFWARWREVAGDLGVRRPFVETLLEQIDTAEELLAELIAEVQAVDVESVKEHLKAFYAESPPQRPRATESRLNPVGAPVNRNPFVGPDT